MLLLLEVTIEVIVAGAIKTGKKHEYTNERKRKLVHQYLNRNHTQLLKRKIENNKKKERERKKKKKNIVSHFYS